MRGFWITASDLTKIKDTNHFIIQLTEAGVSSHLGPNVLLNVEEELRPEPDLVPTLLLLKMVLTVSENPQKLGLVTTKSVQVSVLFMGLRLAGFFL